MGVVSCCRCCGGSIAWLLRIIICKITKNAGNWQNIMQFFAIFCAELLKYAESVSSQ